MTQAPAEFLERVASVLNDAQRSAARAINSTMVHAYWEIGRQIVEEEQHGQDRATEVEEEVALGASEPPADLTPIVWHGVQS